MKLIALTKRNTKNKGKYFAQVDDEDYDYLMQWNWSVDIRKNLRYAYRREKICEGENHKKIYMHSVICGLCNSTLKMIVDHIDRNGLNNQRFNLRITTQSNNMKNRYSVSGSTSKFVGVYLAKDRGKWVAQIRHNKKSMFIGIFTNEEDAARARDAKAMEVFGEYAVLNFPNSNE